MASIKKVIIIGSLGRDPEVRQMPNGTATCTISIATSLNWKNKDSGERQEETEWRRVVFFDRLRTRKWTDKEGKDTHTTEIVAEQMQLLGGRDDAAAPAPAPRAPAPAPRAAAPAAPRRAPPPAGYAGGASGFDEDQIPF